MSFEESLARDERLARGSNARIDARWGVDDLATFSSVTSRPADAQWLVDSPTRENDQLPADPNSFKTCRHIQSGSRSSSHTCPTIFVATDQLAQSSPSAKVRALPRRPYAASTALTASGSNAVDRMRYSIDIEFWGLRDQTDLKEASDCGGDVIDCATDICNYIYETHGRFPAHVDAIYVPGVWLQAFTRRRKYDQKALQVIVPF